MDLKQLEYFVKIAEAHGFKRASGLLNVAQSALSRQVKLLEDELNVPLLVRHGRGAELTPAGTRLLEQAQGLLRHAEQVRDTVIAEGTEPRGELLIGLPAGLATTLGVDLLAELRTRFPRVHAKSIVGTTPMMHDMLVAGHVDIAILGAREHDDMIVSEPVLDAFLHLVGGPQTLRKFGSRATLEQVMELPIILTARTAAIRRLESTAQTAGVELDVVVETDYFPLAIRLMRRGVGFTVMPYEVVAEEVTAGLLDAIPVRELPFQWSIGRPKAKALSPAVRAAQELMRELFARTAGHGSLSPH